MDDEDEVELILQPERATPLRFGLAFLALATEVSQAVTNFFASVTMVTARQVLQDEYDREFKGIVGNYDDASIGAGAVQPEDGQDPATEGTA